MNWRGVLMVVVLVAFVADGSDASLLSNLQKLARAAKNEETVQASPSPSPIPSINGTGGPAKGSSSTAGAPAPSNPPKTDQGGSNNHETCKGSEMNCHNQNITACVFHPANAPMELFLLVNNDGEGTLEVDVTISPVDSTLKDIQIPKIQIPKHQMKKINVSEYAGSPLIALNGDCLIHMGSPPQRDTNFFKQFPAYANQVTPIHGVYLLSLTALLIGGTWACCKLGKKERQVDGVPYQELEMGQPDSLSTIHVETAEGWDRGWDDDWDEENAVKSPGGNNVANGSANGHTSKSSGKDGWEDNWDD